MQILAIIIIVILCLVAVQVIVVVVYIAAKRYYYDHVRRKMRSKRLEKLAMFVPERIDRIKENVKTNAQKQAQKLGLHERSRSVRQTQRESVLTIHEPYSN